MNKNIIVTLYTTEGEVNLALTNEQLIELSVMMQIEEEPVPLVTTIDGVQEEHSVVGMLIQGRCFMRFPRFIVVPEKGENNEES